jgi:hypothetical protein
MSIAKGVVKRKALYQVKVAMDIGNSDGLSAVKL